MTNTTIIRIAIRLDCKNSNKDPNNNTIKMLSSNIGVNFHYMYTSPNKNQLIGIKYSIAVSFQLNRDIL